MEGTIKNCHTVVLEGEYGGVARAGHPEQTMVDLG